MLFRILLGIFHFTTKFMVWYLFQETKFINQLFSILRSSKIITSIVASPIFHLAAPISKLSPPPPPLTPTPLRLQFLLSFIFLEECLNPQVRINEIDGKRTYSQLPPYFFRIKPCPIFKPFHPPFIKLKSLSLHFFIFYKILPFSLTKQINYCGTSYSL